MASGSRPCIHKKLTSTLLVFCSRKTMSTTRRTAARQTPNQAALVLVPDTGPAGAVPDGSGVACGSAAAAESAGAFCLRLRMDMATPFRLNQGAEAEVARWWILGYPTLCTSAPENALEHTCQSSSSTQMAILPNRIAPRVPDLPRGTVRGLPAAAVPQWVEPCQTEVVWPSEILLLCMTAPRLVHSKPVYLLDQATLTALYDEMALASAGSPSTARWGRCCEKVVALRGQRARR
jgi:hypothetical protein